MKVKFYDFLLTYSGNNKVIHFNLNKEEFNTFYYISNDDAR